jgi:hypothetical protein
MADERALPVEDRDVDGGADGERRQRDFARLRRDAAGQRRSSRAANSRLVAVTWTRV